MRQLLTAPLCALILALNVRMRLGETEELRRLGESAIRRLIHPIIIRPDKVVVDGSRRVLGMRMVLGEKSEHPVECLMTDENLSDAQIVEINLTSALHRKGLTGYEQWQGAQKLLELHPGWLGKDLAAVLNLDPGNVSKLLSPSKCIAAWRGALQAGQVTISDCWTASKASEEEQHAMLVAKLNGANREQLERQGRRARGTLGNEPKTSKVKIACERGTVVLTGTDLGMAEIVGVFEELLKDARRAVGVYDVRTWEKMRRDRFSPKQLTTTEQEAANGSQA